MNSEHAKQTKDGIFASLRAAGFKPRFFERSLSSHEHRLSADLIEWVNGASTLDTVSGLTFVGGNAMEDLAILTARALHVTGRSMRQLSMIRLHDMLSNMDRLDAFTGPANGLLLLQAGPMHQREDQCFSHFDIRRIEDFLSDWLMDERRLIVHSPCPLAQGWFSGNLLQRVAMVNDVYNEGEA